MSDWGNKRVVYTLSSKGRLVHDTVRSIRSILHWVPSKRITVFFTPPVERNDLETILELGVDLRQVENETDSFSKNAANPSRHYAEKLKLTRVDSDGVLFLDCDTFVLSDPIQLFDSEAEFRARPGTAQLNLEEFHQLFIERNIEPMDWMPNAGVLVYQNGLHKRIKEDWERYIHTQLEFSADGTTHHEQYALALAVSEHATERLSRKEHVMEWTDQPLSDGIVHHHGLDPQTPPSGLYDSARALIQIFR